MKYVLLSSSLALISSIAVSQEFGSIASNVEQHTEFHAEKDEAAAEYEDDSYLLNLVKYTVRPLNLNKAGSDELKHLPFLNDLQIQSFLLYRRLLGQLVNIYELQAVPYWNINTIKQVLPYTSLSDNNILDNIRERWKGGSHSLLLRTSRVLEKSKGFQKSSGSSQYPGDPLRLYLRYQYNYKNVLQWGLLADKDAGEQLFKGAQKAGFDFYSFHFFLKDTGLVKCLAIGDYRINMGQGLVQWQGIAFGRSSDMANVIRHSQVLTPYTAPSESGFHRGLGLTLQRKKLEGTFFLSYQKISGNLDTDSVNSHRYVSSLLLSGYHRTVGEIADKSNINQLSAGGTLKYSAAKWHLAVNAIRHHWSAPLNRTDKPYNHFAAEGNVFFNASLDYNFVFRNLYVFGEAAINKPLKKAVVNGVLIAVDPKVDVVFLHRLIDKGYHALYSNAFTANTATVNENGVFGGLSIRPNPAVTINCYSDVFRFPWLKYRVDAPSWGKEYQVSVAYKEGKLAEIYSTYRKQQKQINHRGTGNTTSVVETFSRVNWRIQSKIAINRSVSFRNRFEISRYEVNGAGSEHGFMAFMDVGYKPPSGGWSANARIQYFETDGYNARIYAFENDVLYSFSTPALFDKGYRYYLNFHVDCSDWITTSGAKPLKIDYWIRFARTAYPGKTSTGTGADMIMGNRKTEIKMQVMLGI